MKYGGDQLSCPPSSRRGKTANDLRGWHTSCPIRMPDSRFPPRPTPSPALYMPTAHAREDLGDGRPGPAESRPILLPHERTPATAGIGTGTSTAFF